MSHGQQSMEWNDAEEAHTGYRTGDVSQGGMSRAMVLFLGLSLFGCHVWAPCATSAQRGTSPGTFLDGVMQRLEAVAEPYSEGPPGVRGLPLMIRRRLDGGVMRLISGGLVDLGDKGKAPPAAISPSRRVLISTPFYIDVTEVTNAQYAWFVEATGHLTVAERTGQSIESGSKASNRLPEVVRGLSWRTSAGMAGSVIGRPKWPVVHVAWSDAAAYAGWVGGELPTEAQWEAAARGPECRLTSLGGNRPRSAGCGGEVCKLADVCSHGENDYGLCDMIGNVWEWCADWYSQVVEVDAVITDPRGPASGRQRVTRGMGWADEIYGPAQWTGRYDLYWRGALGPDRSRDDLGFRCLLVVR